MFKSPKQSRMMHAMGAQRPVGMSGMPSAMGGMGQQPMYSHGGMVKPGDGEPNLPHDKPHMYSEGGMVEGDEDDMKTEVLHDLMDSLMHMKDREHEPEAHGLEGHDAGAPEMSDGHGEEDPHAKIAMLDIQKDGDHGTDSEDLLDGGDDEESEHDMQKPLGEEDFKAMRRKHLGVG